MQKTLILTVLMLTVRLLTAQQVTISGFVESSESGERLINALVYNADNTKYGTATNVYGFYSLSVPKGNIKMTATYVGFTPEVKEFFVSKDTTINISLVPNTEIGKIVVTGNTNKVENTQMSQVEIPIDIVKKMPVLLGEVDVLKTIQLLPGVQSGTEGTSGIYVRGGGPDQNLILLDGVPVYNVNHLFGFFSVFNGYAISDISLIKGGFPARYGGRLSSVIDIRMKEGNMNHYTGEVSVGIIASKFTIEGPIKKNKASFIVSGRRTYYDLFTLPIIYFATKINDPDINIIGGYYFYDFNAKLNYKIDNKNRIFLSGYFGRDRAYIRSSRKYTDNKNRSNSSKWTSELFWGNITTSFRWNHVFGPKLFANTTATYSNYDFTTSTYMNEQYWDTEDKKIVNELKMKYFSGIEDFAIRTDFDYNPNSWNKIKFGPSVIYHIFKPGVSAFKIGYQDTSIVDTTFGNKNINSFEYGFYIEDDLNINRFFKTNIGARFSAMQLKDTFFYSLEPRISARILVTKKFSIKASYAQMTQYLHFLTNSSIGLPTDLWLPATKIVKPEKSWQTAFGGVFNLFDDNYELAFEGFYKQMDGLIEYKEGESFFSSAFSSANGQSIWEQKVEIGKGNAYGAELFFQKKTGKLTGWIGYTISWSNRQFENISFGKVFPYKYDRRHDIGILLIYKFSEKFDLGITWVYGTGNATTLAKHRYFTFSSNYPSYNYDPYNQTFNYTTIEYYETRNNFRMPAYHRLDIGLNFNKKFKKGIQTWSISIYNAYNRLNPFYLALENDWNLFTNKSETKLYQYSLFPIIPSISYSFKFN